jgi:hypothetical protein
MTNVSCLPAGALFASIKNLFTRKAAQKVASSEPKIKEISEPVLIVDEKAQAELKSLKTK